MTEAFVYDGFFADEFEQLPGGKYIEYREERRRREGKPFSIQDGAEKIEVLPVDHSVFMHYYGIWENYHYFGLPCGGGWIDEKPWVLSVIKMFDGIKDEIKAENERKARKVAEAGAKNRR